jgi:MoxR-like ATPase
LPSVVSVEDMSRMATIAQRIYVAPPLQEYVVAIASATRRLPELRLGVSPRGTLGVTMAAQALAAASGRPFVTAQDVKTVAPNVLAHRMILRPEAQVQGHNAEALLDSILSAVPVPQDRARA